MKSDVDYINEGKTPPKREPIKVNKPTTKSNNNMGTKLQNSVVNKGGAKPGSNNGGGRKKGHPNKATVREIINLHQKIEKLTDSIGKEQEPIVNLIAKTNSMLSQMTMENMDTLWPVLNAMYDTLLQHLYPKYGTIEGIPDLNLTNNNNTQINFNDLTIEQRRQALLIGNKLSGDEDVIDVETDAVFK